MTLKELNNQHKGKAREYLFRCCGSTTWVENLMKDFPFNSTDELKNKSDAIWNNCSELDLLEAFSHHPKIGDKKVEDSKHVATKTWAQQEQSGVKDAEEKVISELAAVNKLYESKFGYIFIVCATGKSAPEMLELLKQRLNNSTEKEIKIAAEEQNKITHLRIDKLLS